MNAGRSTFDDICAIVECLFAAQYTEREIIAYLMGPFGMSEEQATIAVRSTGRPLAYR